MEMNRAVVSLEIYQKAEEEKDNESRVNQEHLLQTDLLRREEIAPGQKSSRINEQSRENTNRTNQEDMLFSIFHVFDHLHVRTKLLVVYWIDSIYVRKA